MMRPSLYVFSSAVLLLSFGVITNSYVSFPTMCRVRGVRAQCSNVKTTSFRISNRNDGKQYMALEPSSGQDTDFNSDVDLVAIQKKRALALWKKICRSLNVPKGAVNDVTRRLELGLVPPVFHAYSTLFKRMGGVKKLQQDAEAPAKERNDMMTIDLDYLPSMSHVTSGIATAKEMGTIVDKKDFMDAFFTDNGEPRMEVKESVSVVWDSVSAENVCRLINTEAQMIGADVEITKVESNFKMGAVTDGSSTHLITRRLSRGVVAESLDMPAADTRAIVGCPGIGKSWTLVYAFQQLLLQNGSCVLFFAAKAGEAFAYIRRDDKVYSWKLSTGTAYSKLFEFENVWVLVDPKEAERGSTEIMTGQRRLLFAASNNEQHFASDMLKTNPKALHFLDPYTEDELRVALPVMSSTNEAFHVEVLDWASKIGLLPRYLLNVNQFKRRFSILENAVEGLTIQEVKEIVKSQGISNSRTILPEIVLAVGATRDVMEDGHGNVPIGYDGESGVIYTELSLCLISDYVLRKFRKKGFDVDTVNVQRLNIQVMEEKEFLLDIFQQ